MLATKSPTSTKRRRRIISKPGEGRYSQEHRPTSCLGHRREATREREEEERETKRELMAIESAARAAYAGDVASGIAVPSAGFARRRPAPPPPTKANSAMLGAPVDPNPFKSDNHPPDSPDEERARILEAAHAAARSRHSGQNQTSWPIPARSIFLQHSSSSDDTYVCAVKQGGPRKTASKVTSQLCTTQAAFQSEVIMLRLNKQRMFLTISPSIR